VFLATPQRWILLAAGLWVPGIWGSHFLSDDFSLIQAWGQQPVWPWFFTETVGYYRPLSALTFRLDYLVWGQWAPGYHLTNILLHTGCALAVGHLAASLGSGRRYAGLWAGLVFLFLPGHVFGVLWVSARTGLLCALCCLASVGWFLRARSTGAWPWEALSLVAFAAALLAKELAISLPLVILAWEAVFSVPKFRRLGRVFLPYAAVLAGYVGFRYALFGHLPESILHTNTEPVRLLLNAATYGAKLFAPWGLEELKPYFRANPAGLWVAVLAGGAAMGGWLWHTRRHLRAAHLLGVLWVAFTLLPVLRLYSPWSTYLAAVGAAILVAFVLDGLERRWVRRLALGVWLALGASYCIWQQWHWQRAGLLGAKIAAALARAAAVESGKIYLANLPVDLGEAPVFGGDWGLTAALHLQGGRADVEVLVGVCKHDLREELVVAPLDEQRFEVKLLSPDDFFRLETIEVLVKQVHPGPGYSYAKGAARISVRGLNRQNEPNHLEIDMGSAERLRQVRVWDGEGLAPVVP
jgi:hypothetical protein